MNQRHYGEVEREGAPNAAISFPPSLLPSSPPTAAARIGFFCSPIAKSPVQARQGFPCAARAYDMTTTH